jgi:hypothetical protein
MEHETREFQIGPHRVRFEPPDLLCVSCNGDFEPEHMRALYDLVGRYAAGPGYVHMLNDMTRLGVVGPETRKFAAQDPNAQKVLAMACVGASFSLRVSVTMVTKAMQIFAGRVSTVVEFFKDEAAARAWLVEQRARRAPLLQPVGR